MSVLIKNMEMPMSCESCPMSHYIIETITGCNITKGKEYVEKEDRDFWYNDKPSWCPLVEVPTPHGRLIDVNELIPVLAAWIVSEDDFQAVLDAVKRIPTVIESEE